MLTNEGVNALHFKNRFRHGIGLHQNRLPELLGFCLSFRGCHRRSISPHEGRQWNRKVPSTHPSYVQREGSFYLFGFLPVENFQNRRTSSRAMPAVGSSKRRTSGSKASKMAISNFRCSPCVRLLAGTFHFVFNKTILSSS